MNAEVMLQSRLGLALPVAAHALPRWQLEMLQDPSSPSAMARRKRQRFGLTDDQAPSTPERLRRVYQSDRFIPSRRATDLEYCSFAVETEFDDSLPACPVKHQAHVSAAHYVSSTASSVSVGQLHCGGNSNEMDSYVRYRETLAANLLYQSPLQQTTGKSRRSLLQFHDCENMYPSALDIPMNGSPTSITTHPSRFLAGHDGAAGRSRHIPSSPTRILDAPELRDDYYLNLVSWGDNNVLAVALDRVVYLYNTDSGAIQEIRACRARDDYVTSVAWIRSGASCEGGAADTNRLAIGTFRSDLQVWDTTSATKVRSLHGHSDRIGALAWQGTCLTSGSRDAKILHHDLRQANSVTATLTGHQQEICGLAWAPDGKTLASGGNDNYLCLWDAKSLDSHTVAPRQRLLEHRAAVKALAWCPWERHLLASGGGTADRTIKFWHAGTGRLLNSVHTGSQVCCLVWSKTERELLSSHGFSQNELCLWRYPTMVRLREFTGHTARVLHLAMSPDGSSVVSAAADETLRFWNVFASAKRTLKPSLLLSMSQRSFFPNAVIR